MKKPQYQILLYYKYTQLDDPKKNWEEQRKLCQELNLKGRIILAKEGINGTVEGLIEDTEKYILETLKVPEFSDMTFKKSVGTGAAFPKLSVKVRGEIVAGRLGENDVRPYEVTGKHLDPEKLHEWFETGKEFYIVDMRNDFEQEVGYFQDSLLTRMTTFADLPKVVEQIEHLRGKTIVTVCTGGVRCEKASGFLVTHGFADVYQLSGGIVSYMERYPNQNFKGALYVFDNRLIMGFNLDDPKREIVGHCAKCHKASEHFINCSDDFCHRHFILCEQCCEVSRKCPMGCRDYSKEHPETLSMIQ